MASSMVGHSKQSIIIVRYPDTRSGEARELISQLDLVYRVQGHSTAHPRDYYDSEPTCRQLMEGIQRSSSAAG
jgi:hypothetical protein